MTISYEMEIETFFNWNQAISGSNFRYHAGVFWSVFFPPGLTLQPVLQFKTLLFLQFKTLLFLLHPESMYLTDKVSTVVRFALCGAGE